MKFAIAQMNPTICDFEENLRLIKSHFLNALHKEPALDLIIYPELTLCGYYPGDLIEEPFFELKITKAYAEFKEFTTQYPNVNFVIGLPTKSTEFKLYGKRWFNTLQIIKNGQTVLEYHKQLLPTYGVFDEKRHFQPGPNIIKVTNINGIRIGFIICEDGWNDLKEDYENNPFELLKNAAPDLVVSINASPANVGKSLIRKQLFANASSKYGFPIAYVNQVGGNDQLVFDGASFIVSPTNTIWQGPSHVEDTFCFDVNTNGVFNTIEKSFELVSDPSDFYYRQIILGLKDYTRKTGFKGAVIGSSGGIDSALTLYFAAKALGNENTIAITMPSMYSSEGSISDSAILCSKLGVALIEHPIKSTVSALMTQFEDAVGSPLTGVAEENIQPRIRGTILMAYSNQFGHLVLTTGNKSEVSVGYCTLYGDTNGGLGLIGDLYKTEIFELCRYINKLENQEIIPNSIIEKAPSAELRPDQKDTDSLPPYEILDELLKIIIEGSRLSASEYAKAKQVYDANIESGLVAKIEKMVARNEYKRKQMPPVIKVRARAFGSGRQVPIASKQF